MLLLLGSGWVERRQQPQTMGSVCLLLRPLGCPQAFCFSSPSKPGVPGLYSGLRCNAWWEKGLSLCPADNRGDTLPA